MYGERWRVLADGVAGVVVWVVIGFISGSVFAVEYGVMFLENASLVDQHQFVGRDAEHFADVAL